MEFIGLIGSVVLLIWLALRGVEIVFAAVLCSLVVIVTNDLPIAEGITDFYSFGPLGAFTFAGKFFLLFIAGAMFGRVMGDSQAAASIALALVRRLGAHRALWIATLSCALLTYGGVVVFVVIFAMYPLGLRLLQEADIPKRLLCAALALGAGTFTLSALPGTPSVQNVISAVALDTDLFAGGWIGMVGAIVMFSVGMWYLERQRVLAAKNGEHFVPGPRDRISTKNEDYQYRPPWQLAMLPLVLVLVTIILPRLISLLVGEATLHSGGWLFELLRFAVGQPIVWPSVALLLGTLLAVSLFPTIRRGGLTVMGQGVNDAILPLINTAAVIGFGGVVTHTAGFEAFTRMMLDSALPPLLSLFASVSLVSAITGSASGGLQIFMQTMAPAYLEMGLEAGVVHRIATMASGGFDSLPHCGSVVAMLTITGMTHREAYRDVGIITVVIPVLATLCAMGVAALVWP
jgi:H+/gluconate symporter-like permease